MGSRNGAPAQEAPRRRLRFGEDEAAPAGLVGLDDLGPCPRQIARGHIREVARDPVQGRVGIKIADDDQDGPVRPVVCLVERSQVVGADPRDVFGPAQDRVAIRMTKVGERQMGLVEPALGRIELAGPFLDDHAALDLDLAGVEPRPRIRSASIASASSQRSLGNANQ